MEGEVAGLVAMLGGVARRGALVDAVGRSSVDRALRHGEIVARGRGRYALAGAEEHLQLAHALSGSLCLTSAALWHGWEVARPPDRPHVLVPKNRKVDQRHRAVHVHRGVVVGDLVTDQLATLEMCLRLLPFSEALAVADSYLRHGGYRETLRGIAASARGPGSRQVRRVVREARGEADNPFESTLRAIALDVPDLHVEPQVPVVSRVVRARPDLVDRDLRIVLEADSFAWHGDRAALDRDCLRYDLLVADGWVVLRFSWEQVMLRSEEVHRILELVVRRTQRGARCTCVA